MMSDQRHTVPRLDVKDAGNFVPLPEANGHQAWLYKSGDGRVKAGSFKEHGKFEYANDFDEFMYVIGGSTTITVEGGESFTVKAGECAYLRKGLKFTFESDDDFHDVAVLISDSM